MTKHITTTTGPPSTSTRTSCFLGCFGCSSKKTQPTYEINSSSRWRKWNLFKKSPKKTVPVDLTIVSNDDPKTTISDTSWEIQVVEENATSIKKHVTSSEQKASRKKWKMAVNRQKEMKPVVMSATGPSLVSVEEKTVTNARHSFSSPLRPMALSKSVLPPKQQKPPQHVSAAGGKDDGGVLQRTPLSSREFDSIIGMSIILVILVILVLWGKLCAILCTSAWFFIAPRLVAIGKHSAVATAAKLMPESHKNMDLESEEYKKKVVLEGLLQRDHRKVVGRL